jgi:hypothetical protein
MYKYCIIYTLAMISYILGDTIYFLYNSRVTYGVITNITINGADTVYTVTDSSGNTYSVDYTQAFPNAFPLVTPTPTISNTVTPSLTSSLTVTPTQTLSLTSTVTYPNLFPSNTVEEWTSQNGEITTTENAYINFISNGINNELMAYSTQFSVEAEKFYHFSVYYQEGTIRYGKMFLSIDEGTIYAISQVAVQENGALLSCEFSDSGRLDLDLFVSSGSTLTLVVQFYDDPNYDGNPDIGFTYRFTDTVLQMYGNYSNVNSNTISHAYQLSNTNNNRHADRNTHNFSYS